jgi:peptide/nickel transport system substrate-binding protein
MAGLGRIGRRALLQTAAGVAGLSALGGFRNLLAAEGAAAEGGTLVVGEGFDITTLDPARTLDLTSCMVNLATYDTLVTFTGEDLKTPKPLLASSWHISSDGKTYTFTIRRGAKFATGREAGADDVKWSFDRLRNVKGISSFLLDGVDAIAVRDPQTVIIQLKAPQPSLIPILAHPSLGVLDSKTVAEHGGNATPDAKTLDRAEQFLNQQSPGTGPFIRQSYSPGNELVLVRNTSYWRGTPKVARVRLRNIQEPASQQLQVEHGDIDVADTLGHPQAEALRGRPGVVVSTSPSATTFWIAMNMDPAIGGPFANPKVQQAVRYALDYNGIMKLAGAGAVRLAGLLSPSFPGALPASAAIKTDQAKARALLKEAGMAEVHGKFSYPSGWVRYGVQIDPIIQKIQSDLAEVGVKMDLDGSPIVTAKQLARSGKAQFMLYSWAADYADQDDYLVFLPGRLVGNRAHWTPDASPAAQEVSKLGHEAETEPDDRKRVALYQRVDRLFAESSPFVPLFVPAVPYAYRSNVRGATYNTMWELDLYAISKQA